MSDYDGDGVSRRRFLTRASVGVAGVTATAGCLASGLDPFGDESGMLLRASTASGGETETTCRLSSAFVSNYPALKRVLDTAAEGASDEWASTRFSLERGESLGAALQEHCGGETRGIYRYDGDWYFVSLRYEDPADHSHNDGHDHGSHDHETTTADGHTTTS